jgi:hypothetical protein
LQFQFVRHHACLIVGYDAEIVIKRGASISSLRDSNLVYERLDATLIVILILYITGLGLLLELSFPPAYSDTMTGGTLSQRIGSFDMELKTIPSTPIAGDETDIFLRIGTIDGNDAVDTPITISIAKQGDEMFRSNTIFVPNGHYTYPYRFAESGIYGMYILVHDSSAIDETRTSSVATSSIPISSQGRDILFTFPVDVHSKSMFEFSGIQLGLILGVVATVSAITIFHFRAKKTRGERSFRATRLS